MKNTQVAIREIGAIAKKNTLFTKAQKIKINALTTLTDGIVTVYIKAINLKQTGVEEIEVLQTLVLKLSEVINEWPENGEKEKERIIKLIRRIEQSIVTQFDKLETGDYIG